MFTSEKNTDVQRIQIIYNEEFVPAKLQRTSEKLSKTACFFKYFKSYIICDRKKIYSI